MSITLQQLVHCLSVNSEFAVEDFVLLRLKNILDTVVVEPLEQETLDVLGAEEVCE